MKKSLHRLRKICHHLMKTLMKSLRRILKSKNHLRKNHCCKMKKICCSLMRNCYKMNLRNNCFVKEQNNFLNSCKNSSSMSGWPVRNTLSGYRYLMSCF